jgi:hypothetical protein
MKTLREIPLSQFAQIAGGTGDVKPVLITPSGMAPPKYSAGWWDFVRARGLGK